MAGRIDVHHHVLPEFYIEAQRGAGITGSAYRGFPEWSAEHSLSVMETEEIATSVLSFTSPGIWFGDIDQTKALARQCNEFLAGLAEDHPGRFGGFAFLPLPDLDAALSEMAHALDDLKLDGITLLTSISAIRISSRYTRSSTGERPSCSSTRVIRRAPRPMAGISRAC